jgi:CBS domain-containing protein
MKTIKQILAEKTKPLTTVAIDATVQKALELMCERNVGAVIVVDGAKMKGIFTERDCLQKVAAVGLDPHKSQVRDVMTSKVHYATLEMEVSQGLVLMTERFLRHLPVLDAKHNILGIVSIGDLVKAKIADQNFTIEQLERYITS